MKPPVPALPHARASRRARVGWPLRLCALALALAPLHAAAQAAAEPPALDAELLQRLQALGEQAGAGLAPGTARVEIEPGRLDPRLRLAPCDRIEPYLPAGARVWGRSRVGLRCVEGPAAWNVSLPVTVKVFAPAWVLAAPLPAGSVLQAEHLRQAEVDWAAAPTPPLVDLSRLVGRQLSRPLPAGAPVRGADLRQRQWFGAGDTVQIIARGQGYSVGGTGQAMSAGIEGQPVRVRIDNGRVLTGQAVGQNQVEVAL
jgi:flagellar basal body P-ring formation protein FlgA